MVDRVMDCGRSGVQPRTPSLAGVARRLESAPPQEVLRWADRVFAEKLALSVSFGGMEGMVLLEMLSRITNRATVFTLDTGFLFEETVSFRKEIMRHCPLELEVVEPSLCVEEQVERYGPELYTCKPDLCCQVRKVEPQRRFLGGYEGWVSGIRRDQTPGRAKTPVVEWDEYFGVVKVSPLAGWGEGEVMEYAAERGVPLNPLLHLGYRSIGCEPQTRPVAPDEGVRAGRWPGMEKTECGIHVANGKVDRAVS